MPEAVQTPEVEKPSDVVPIKEVKSVDPKEGVPPVEDASKNEEKSPENEKTDVPVVDKAKDESSANGSLTKEHIEKSVEPEVNPTNTDDASKAEVETSSSESPSVVKEDIKEDSTCDLKADKEVEEKTVTAVDGVSVEKAGSELNKNKSNVEEMEVNESTEKNVDDKKVDKPQEITEKSASESESSTHLVCSINAPKDSVPDNVAEDSQAVKADDSVDMDSSNKTPSETNTNDKPSGEANGNEGGGTSSNTNIDPEKVEEIKKLMREAKEKMVVAEFSDAANLYSSALEVSVNMYGDLASENAELYYLYACAMLECAKSEAGVFGVAVKENDEDEEEEDNNEAENNDGSPAEEANGDYKMEVTPADGETVTPENRETVKPEKENGEAETMAVDSDKGEAVNESDKEKDSAEDSSEPNDDKEKDAEEEEDSNLKTAWENFEVAKVIFGNNGNDMRLADTYIKLGETGMELGHEGAINDMKYALELRLKCAGENERLLAEAHFNIGLAYATFQKFDDAIESFTISKTMLAQKIETLKSGEQTQEVQDEIKEISAILPDLDEKISDMQDSKLAKEKAEKENPNSVGSGSNDASDNKPVSNISHLVKRKRKLEDVALGLLPSSKQACTQQPTEEPAS